MFSMTLLLLSRTSAVIVTVEEPSDGSVGLEVSIVNEPTAAAPPPGPGPPPTSDWSLPPLQAVNTMAAAVNHKL
jgi:hypothetical protein